jgi:S-adenosylmethionine:tRNA ribosyltransferase-isomerase
MCKPVENPNFKVHNWLKWVKIKAKCTFATMKPTSLIPINDFDYELPSDRIAFSPLPNREESKLLVWDQAIVAESNYHSIDQFIPSTSCLFFNNSKVIAARILFEKKSNAIDKNESLLNVVDENNTLIHKTTNNHSQAPDISKSIIEIFCLEPTPAFNPVHNAMQAQGKVQWVCLVGSAKKWKEEFLEKEIFMNDKIIHFKAKKIKQIEGKFEIEFTWNDKQINFSEILQSIGQIPLPPYIEREANEWDAERYQTTYASVEGSVAAPTAGLHFSESLLQKIKSKGIEEKFITLHVGAGTFMPVKTENINEHVMHAEFVDVTKQTVQFLAETDQNIIAVGTTSLRTIESLYWLGLKLMQATIQPNAIELLQWDAYQLKEEGHSKKEVLLFLLNWMQDHQLNQLIFKTQLMVIPGYQFKITHGLITNFHQPKSTLLLIIAAITGDHWKFIYQHAITHKYRFLSYGDGCFFKFPNLKK